MAGTSGGAPGAGACSGSGTRRRRCRFRVKCKTRKLRMCSHTPERRHRIQHPFLQHARAGSADFVMVFGGPISRTLFFHGFGVEAVGPSKGDRF